MVFLTEMKRILYLVYVGVNCKRKKEGGGRRADFRLGPHKSTVATVIKGKSHHEITHKCLTPSTHWPRLKIHLKNDATAADFEAKKLRKKRVVRDIFSSQQKCVNGFKWDYTNEQLLFFTLYRVFQHLYRILHSKCIDFHSKCTNLHCQ